MKQLALCTLFALVFSPLFADTTISDDNSQKHYCSTSDVEIYETTILVHVEDEVFETDSLLVDQGGIYYLENRLRCPECRKPLNPKNTCEYPHFRLPS